MNGCIDIYVLFQLLDAALKNPEQSKFFVESELAKYRGFGGVSIVCVQLSSLRFLMLLRGHSACDPLR